MQGNLGLEGRRQWKLQGTLGGGEYEVRFWLNPSQVYIEPFCAFSLFPANLALLAFLHYQKLVKLIILKIIIINLTIDTNIKI